MSKMWNLKEKKSQEKYMQNLSYRKIKSPEFLNISLYIINLFSWFMGNNCIPK